MTITKTRTLRLFAPGLYTWRHLELSHSDIMREWNLTWSGSTKRLPCGAADRQFPSLATVRAYLEPHGFAVEESRG